MNFASQNFSDTNLSQEKKLFRKNSKNILKKITGNFQKIKEDENSVCTNLVNDKIYKEADLILTFMPLKDEMPVLKITEKSLFQKTILFKFLSLAILGKRSTFRLLQKKRSF